MQDKDLEEMAQMPNDDYLSPKPEEPPPTGEAGAPQTESEPEDAAEADAPSTYGAP